MSRAAAAAPALKGRRLAMRPLVPGDAPALLEAVAASRRQLKRRFGWVEAAADAEDFRRFIELKAGEWKAGVSCTFGVFELRGERLLGVASLDPIQRETLKAPLSIWIRADEQDKGHGTEAGRLALEHAFKTLELHRVYARIDPANRAARKVVQRLGLRYEGCLKGDKRLNGRWVDQECWGALRAGKKAR